MRLIVAFRFAPTVCFSAHASGVLMCSASEIQKFTLSSEMAGNTNFRLYRYTLFAHGSIAFFTKFAGQLVEVLGDLFLGCDMPEAQKPSFFKTLFTSNAQDNKLNRDELCTF